MIFTREKILELVAHGEVMIEPFDDAQVGPGSIDLHLGNAFRVFKKAREVVKIKEEADYIDVTQPITISSEPLLLEPGELVHGITRERVTLPSNISGRIEGRSRFARLGLLVHISSGFISPGSDGRVVLEIANLSPSTLALYAGTKICQIILEEVTPPARYVGKFRGQMKP